MAINIARNLSSSRFLNGLLVTLAAAFSLVVFRLETFGPDGMSGARLGVPGPSNCEPEGRTIATTFLRVLRIVRFGFSGTTVMPLRPDFPGVAVPVLDAGAAAGSVSTFLVVVVLLAAFFDATFFVVTFFVVTDFLVAGFFADFLVVDFDALTFLVALFLAAVLAVFFFADFLAGASVRVTFLPAAALAVFFDAGFLALFFAGVFLVVPCDATFLLATFLDAGFFVVAFLVVFFVVFFDDAARVAAGFLGAAFLVVLDRVVVVFLATGYSEGRLETRKNPGFHAGKGIHHP